MQSIGYINLFSNTADQVDNYLYQETCVSSLHTKLYALRTQNLSYTCLFLLFAFRELSFCFIFTHFYTVLFKVTVCMLLIRE